MHDFKLQVTSFCQNQKLQIMVERFCHIPQRTALCKNSDFGFQLCLFVILDDDRQQLKMKNSQFNFSMLCGVVGYFDTNISYLLLISFSDITGHSMSKPRMRKERNNIISTLPQRNLILFEINIQPCGILGNLNKKYLINCFSRTMWSSVAVRIVPEREMAYNFFGCC